MTIKKAQLERRVITKVDKLDLSNLYVYETTPGKSRPVQRQMTIRDLIASLAAYDLDGVIEYYDEGYYNTDPTLAITVTRLETDDEYAERIAILEKVEKDKKDKKEKAKQQKNLKKQEELDTLKRLAKKYNVDITKELP